MQSIAKIRVAAQRESARIPCLVRRGRAQGQAAGEFRPILSNFAGISRDHCGSITRDLVMLRRTSFFAVFLALAVSLPAAARAAVTITVDKSSQRMSVAVDGATRYSWPVSTGRAGYGTPNGSYSPTRLERSWFSRQYYNSPMPHSIFFHGGFAIHGSYEISRLGGPASHGCIRLHPSNAATLFGLVKTHGAGNTRILVTGGDPAPRRAAPRVAPGYAAGYAPYYQPGYQQGYRRYFAPRGYWGGWGGYPGYGYRY
jgi:hypothetical protein